MKAMTVADFRTLSRRDYDNGAVRDEIYQALKEGEALKVEVAQLNEDNKELEFLFDLQYGRMTEATAWWQELTGKRNTWPDLGHLLTTMLFVIDLHDTVEEGFKTEVERLQAKICDHRAAFQKIVDGTTEDQRKLWWCKIACEVLGLPVKVNKET